MRNNHQHHHHETIGAAILLIKPDATQGIEASKPVFVYASERGV